MFGLRDAKILQHCTGGSEKKGANGIRANTGLALSGDQVFPWVLEYYAKDDEKEIKLMHHCVNNTETYYERMSQQESYILFLRKTEQPTEAYYTFEVEPDGTIRQTRTFYNQ